MCDMKKSPIPVNRIPIRIEPNPSRVIPRFFFPGDDLRARRTIERVLAIEERSVSAILDDLRRSYRGQHEDIDQTWRSHFDRVKRRVPVGSKVSDERALLIGAYFTMEYAIESAALFNPSIVPAFDQTGLPEGSTRFIVSLRATGEGHVSSIVFRRGVIDSSNHIVISGDSPVSRTLEEVEDTVYDGTVFRKTLVDVGASSALAEDVLKQLGERFTYSELTAELREAARKHDSPSLAEECVENVMCLARSNYTLRIPDDAYPSELVIFPSSENESRGIEDVRLVRFVENDGTSRLYGTYTAYNGYATFPTLLETPDYHTVQIRTMYGRYAKNKGMALFPRRIDGKYIMSGRLDGENLYVLESDNIRFWDEGRLAQTPKYWWETVVIGNCGSPLETDQGWLLLTHGVGPMRQYCNGAALLDLDDPHKLIGRTKEPLIVPTAEERVGYVPNVAYTCGAMIHNDDVLIPYAMSDMVTTFATVPLPDLLRELRKG